VDQAGLWSELSFRLRRPLGFITGTIDKLLVSRALDGDGFDVEIIDFKTNRLGATQRALGVQNVAVEGANAAPVSGELARRGRSARFQVSKDQFSFDFSAPADAAKGVVFETGKTQVSVEEQARRVAADYQLQMQAYALAVSELLPDVASPGRVMVTLHFLQPDIEFHLTPDALKPEVCASAIDEAMLRIVSAIEPDEFPVSPAVHCRMCNFLEVCAEGRAWLRTNREVPRQRRHVSAMISKEQLA
jgi:hypothetical protein